jgi:hypothetical protein
MSQALPAEPTAGQLGERNAVSLRYQVYNLAG